MYICLSLIYHEIDRRYAKCQVEAVDTYFNRYENTNRCTISSTYTYIVSGPIYENDFLQKESNVEVKQKSH